MSFAKGRFVIKPLTLTCSDGFESEYQSHVISKAISKGWLQIHNLRLPKLSMVSVFHIVKLALFQADCVFLTLLFLLLDG